MLAPTSELVRGDRTAPPGGRTAPLGDGQPGRLAHKTRVASLAMDAEDARSFIRTHHRAVLATTQGDGRPQLSPVTTAIDGGGRAVVSTRAGAMKTANVRRRPWAALCVVSDQF